MQVICVALLFLASPASTARIDVKTAIASPNDGVGAFMAWADANGCSDCSLIVGSLAQGVADAGYMETSTWDGTALALTVSLTKYKLYGEIATASHVPVMWTLDRQLTFQVQPKEKGVTTIRVTGLHNEPSKQGLGLYEAVMAANSELDPASCITEQKCREKEQAAAGKYLKDNFWKNKKIKDQDGKISVVLKPLYDKLLTRTAVGKDWPKVFYSMIAACPLTVTSIIFDNGEVSATTELYTAIDERYQRYHLREKASAMGAKSLADAQNTMFLAEKASRSGINLAKMFAFGDPVVQAAMSKLGLKAGNPNAIANLFRWCKGSTAGSDPACKSSTPGRLAWGDYPSARMTDNSQQ